MLEALETFDEGSHSILEIDGVPTVNLDRFGDGLTISGFFFSALSQWPIILVPRVARGFRWRGDDTEDGADAWPSMVVLVLHQRPRLDVGCSLRFRMGVRSAGGY